MYIKQNCDLLLLMKPIYIKIFSTKSTNCASKITFEIVWLFQLNSLRFPKVKKKMLFVFRYLAHNFVKKPKINQYSYKYQNN